VSSEQVSDVPSPAFDS